MAGISDIRGEYRPRDVPKVVFGRGSISQLQQDLGYLKSKRVLVLSGRSVAENTEAVSKVVEALGDYHVGTYSGLTMRAPLSAAVEAAKIAIDTEADTFVGVGGSTISDAARMIGVMMVEGITDVEAIRARGRESNGLIRPEVDASQLPKQVSIPTTLSAGEFNLYGGNVLDTEAQEKIRVTHRDICSHVVFLDPEMTIGTPDWLWHSTGIKALDHAIERLYGKGNQPAVDAPVLMAAELIFRYLPVSGEKYGDLDARLQCLIAAWLSMMGVPNVMTGLSHAIGHVIGVKYSVPHGYTSCVMQPHVMEYNRPVSAHKQAMLARAAGIDTRGMSDEAASIEAANAVEKLILGLGLPHRLRELEIPREELRSIAELTLHDGAIANNAIPVTAPEQVLKVLEKAW